MTSMITILVMIPVAFFPKTGMDAYQPLGTVILGGLIMGTVLSLFDIPIMHTYVDDFIKWLNWKFLKRRWEWPVTAHFGDDGQGADASAALHDGARPVPAAEGSGTGDGADGMERTK
jgi:HAE1 family hydrophobic/amphiphilic exporter-1